MLSVDFEDRVYISLLGPLGTIVYLLRPSNLVTSRSIGPLCNYRSTCLHFIPPDMLISVTSVLKTPDDHAPPLPHNAGATHSAST